MSTQPPESQSIESFEGVEGEAPAPTESQPHPESPEAVIVDPPLATEPQPSYVKLAMRNMVRKRGTSIYHFTLTTLGLLGVLVGLAYLTR
ncbi:MAG: DUF3285 domain-containing protein [Oculatellaceae cyanobacterium bins.114]|nr:DUF3285 domain-containing protein [Oculatellaceae cyanobacterium bins.114]